jgi:F-type H+-transporting ATPase subunit b
MVIVLVVIIFLLGKFAWKPIVDALDEREKGIASALEAAEKAKLEMARLTNENEQLLKKLAQNAMLSLRKQKNLKIRL